MRKLELSVADQAHWYKRSLDVNSPEWRKLRQSILDRDANTCSYCGYAASSWQICHHVNGNACDNRKGNLTICCQMCNMILHCGLGGMRKAIRIEVSSMPQEVVVTKTRDYFRRVGKVPRPVEIDPTVSRKRTSEFGISIVEFANLMSIDQDPREFFPVEIRGFFDIGAGPFIEKQLYSMV
jgi:hypothetical protein